METRNHLYVRILSSVMFLSLLAFVITPGAYAAVDGDGTDVVNENYEAQLSLQPLAPAFRVKTLLEWSPDDDPDAELNRSSVPLNKNRFKGHQVNPLAHPEAGITSAAITTWNHDEASSVGGNEFNVYAFDNWQLLDSYIYWAGTNEGIFAIPTPDIVDAAHRNGVPVYATVGFPWGPGSPAALAEIVAFTQQNTDGTFPVADKMIEVAEYFGFDGYFMNQETYGVNKATAERMNEMMRYVKRKSDIRFGWYDAQDNNGNVSHQNAVNSNNDMYVKPAADGKYAVDEFFMNYNWGVNQINTTVATMKSHNRDPFDAYAGFEIQQNSYNTRVNTGPLLDEKKQPKVSIALYTPNSTMGLAANPADFHEKEKYLWTGPQGDPTLADDSANWKGMARFITDSSVIEGMPFTTNFNSGHGKQYFVDGKLSSSQEWNNRSVQDIMPTWRWWVRSEGSRINVSYDFDQAYNGGNSLKFSGTLSPNSKNDTLLYSTKLQVTDQTKVQVVYQNPSGADVSLGVAYSQDYSPDQMKHYVLPETGQGWKKAVIDLGEEAGQTIYALSLKISNSDKLENAAIHLGQLSVYQSKSAILSAPKDVKVSEQLVKSALNAEARIQWSAQNEVLHYEVYQKNADGVPALIGVTPSHYFYTSNISRTTANASEDNITTLEIVPVNQDYVRGNGAEVAFNWGIDSDASEVDHNPPSPNVALNAKITSISFENAAEPASKALDGTATGNSKWAATNKSNGYMSIDIGESKTIRRWRVEHAEYGGEASNMNTIDFELLYKDGTGNWVSAKRIKDNKKAVTDVVLDEPITAQEFKLQVYNSGSSPWGAIRIYEWQMFESASLPKTENIMMHFVTAQNNTGPKDRVVIEGVRKGQTVRLYKSLDTKEVLAEQLAEENGAITFEALDFGPEAGRIYYTVQSDGLGESLRFSKAYLAELVVEAGEVISQSGMTAVATSSEEGHEPAKALDGDPATTWHTTLTPAHLPESITLDLGGSYDVNELKYLPGSETGDGLITKYNIYVSTDGVSFTKVDSGMWEADGQEKNAIFQKTKAAYLRLEAVQGVGGVASAAELNVYHVPPHSVDRAETTLSSPSSVKSGEDFTVQVGLREVKESIYALDILMDYDANLLEFVSAEPMKEGVGLIETVKDTAGKLRFIMASSGASHAIASDVELLEITYKAKTVEQSVKALVSVTNTTMGDNTGAETKATPSSTEVEITADNITPEPSGDINHDGKVSIGDLAMIAANYGKTSDSADWVQIKHMDVNSDGKIDILDLSFVARKILE
ncbi:endo-beta-N-acetylglucosaminidase [Paenibacillus sp. EC2-1]|uniref:endo-beta-N-acetylglucosaminidase n=1 Tax=Paenibacillus sp. EC2-1 TaxID=3388665 RepID=UPI003BEF3E60